MFGFLGGEHVPRARFNLGLAALGALLLVIPIAFVIGALSGHPPIWGLLQNPVVLLGSLSLAAVGNLWSMVHVEVMRGKPPILRIDISGNALSLIVVTVAGLLGALLLAYAFVENFARR